MHVAILHYAAPPIVGGVESTIYHHARLLAGAGYTVTVVAGRGAPFHLTEAIQQTLRRALAGSDVCVVHNAITLHKNLPLTTALHQLITSDRDPRGWIAWHHDFAWLRPQYQNGNRSGGSPLANFKQISNVPLTLH
jgi:hypothetical protein